MSPTLSQEDIDRMRDRPPKACYVCKAMVSQNYCRQCDQFFTVGHEPTCSTMNAEDSYGNNHEGHRTY